MPDNVPSLFSINKFLATGMVKIMQHVLENIFTSIRGKQICCIITIMQRAHSMLHSVVTTEHVHLPTLQSGLSEMFYLKAIFQFKKSRTL